jgi:hypothetical protein
MHRLLIPDRLSVVGIQSLERGVLDSLIPSILEPDYPMDSDRIPKPQGVTPMDMISVIDTKSSDYQKGGWDLIFIYLPAR